MRTNVDIAIQSEVMSGRWYFADNDSEDTEFSAFGDLPEDRQKELAKRYGVTVEFMDELLANLQEMRDAIHTDLADIWKRLDAMEKKNQF